MLVGENAYDIPAGADAYGELLKTRFPKESHAIDEYRSLIGKVSKPSGPFFAEKAMPEEVAEKFYEKICAEFHGYSRQTTIDVLPSLTSIEELIAVLCANWGDYTLGPSKNSFAMHCMLAKHYMNGAHYLVGGGSAFSESMVPFIESAGGAVLHGAEVKTHPKRMSRRLSWDRTLSKPAHSSIDAMGKEACSCFANRVRMPWALWRSAMPTWPDGRPSFAAWLNRVSGFAPTDRVAGIAAGVIFLAWPCPTVTRKNLADGKSMGPPCGFGGLRCGDGAGRRHS
ncbi:hypothetical protein [Variovorax sp. J31P207]|uniref:hypothetical protein n=1 Tax=Variovorax sp. J31P207 TaxID=3053510 RepID=UPI0025776BE6|nr:hypothetical protein [Variovorax sp. J31P207]MDM0071691.1 hypothetical protein [Variovorax sp. J31P207]